MGGLSQCRLECHNALNVHLYSSLMAVVVLALCLKATVLPVVLAQQAMGVVEPSMLLSTCCVCSLSARQ